MAALLKFKDSVHVPRTVLIAIAAINAANALKFEGEMWITSGNDSIHMQGSKHYSDEALDFRTHQLPTAQKHAWKDEIARRLGKGYDLLLEDENGSNEHLHVEWDPKP